MKFLKPKSQEEYIQVQEERHTSLVHEYPISPWHEDLFTKFNQHLKAPIIDIGTRNGKILDVLEEKGFESWGVELTDIAKWAQFNRRKVIQCDIHERTLFPDKFFKTAIMTHALEHCYDMEKVLKEINRILEGHFYLVTLTGGSIEQAHYINFENIEEIVELLENNGFKVDDYYSTGNAYNYIFANNL